MDFKTAVGLKIREAREDKGLTQAALASLAGLSEKHISLLERGEKMPRLDSFVAICNGLEVSANSLLSDVLKTVPDVDYAIMSETSELLMLIAKEPAPKRKNIISAFITLLKQ